MNIVCVFVHAMQVWNETNKRAVGVGAFFFLQQIHERLALSQLSALDVRYGVGIHIKERRENEGGLALVSSPGDHL
jgi:hypothetical protein